MLNIFVTETEWKLGKLERTLNGTKITLESSLESTVSEVASAVSSRSEVLPEERVVDVTCPSHKCEKMLRMQV